MYVANPVETGLGYDLSFKIFVAPIAARRVSFFTKKMFLRFGNIINFRTFSKFSFRNRWIINVIVYCLRLPFLRLL